MWQYPYMIALCKILTNVDTCKFTSFLISLVTEACRPLKWQLSHGMTENISCCITMLVTYFTQTYIWNINMHQYCTWSWDFRIWYKLFKIRALFFFLLLLIWIRFGRFSYYCFPLPPPLPQFMWMDWSQCIYFYWEVC